MKPIDSNSITINNGQQGCLGVSVYFNFLNQLDEPMMVYIFLCSSSSINIGQTEIFRDVRLNLKVDLKLRVNLFGVYKITFKKGVRNSR